MEEIKAGQISILKTARYYIIGKPGKHIRTILYVLHGYGMNASSFIRKFSSLADTDLLIVAPEGLSRFYKNGFSGDVVASWMTREDRDLEITDYINYLNHLHQSFDYNEDVNVVVLGFSQGTSTASRWVMNGQVDFHSLVLWGGEFAPDIMQFNTKLKEIYCVAGDNDEYISAENFNKLIENIENKGFRVIKKLYNGSHNIDNEALKEVWRKIFSES